MSIYAKLLIAGCSLALMGCAATTHTSQHIRIDTYDTQNKIVEGVKCTAKNDRGEWGTKKNPGSLSVDGSGKNLLIKCQSQAGEAGYATLISSGNNSQAGSLLESSGQGRINEHYGNVYIYPEWIKVVMGETLVFDRKDHMDNRMMTGDPASGKLLKQMTDAQQKGKS